MTKDPSGEPAGAVGATAGAAAEAGLLLPRKRPIQKRSIERFERILSCAREVLVCHGFESFTFDEVARRAEVPIGTLYQFFANKYVLVCELDRQDTAHIVAELRVFAQRVPAPQWPEFLEEFIDKLASLWREDPSRRAVWHAVQSTPATRTTAKATETELVELIAHVVRTLSGNASEEQRREIAGILVHTVTTLLNYAVRDNSEEVFGRTVGEMKRMLIAYLFAVAAGVGPAPDYPPNAYALQLGAGGGGSAGGDAGGGAAG